MSTTFHRPDGQPIPAASAIIPGGTATGLHSDRSTRNLLAHCLAADVDPTYVGMLVGYFKSPTDAARFLWESADHIETSEFLDAHDLLDHDPDHPDGVAQEFYDALTDKDGACWTVRVPGTRDGILLFDETLE